jgi:hypothetical protein
MQRFKQAGRSWYDFSVAKRFIIHFHFIHIKCRSLQWLHFSDTSHEVTEQPINVKVLLLYLEGGLINTNRYCTSCFLLFLATIYQLYALYNIELPEGK